MILPRALPTLLIATLAIPAAAAPLPCQTPSVALTPTSNGGLNISVTADPGRQVMIVGFVSVRSFASSSLLWNHFLNQAFPPIAEVNEPPASFTAALNPLSATLSVPSVSCPMPAWAASQALGQLNAWADVTRLAQAVDNEGQLEWESQPATWYQPNQPVPVIPWKDLAFNTSQSSQDFDLELLTRAFLANQFSHASNSQIGLDDPLVDMLIDIVLAQLADFDLHVLALVMNDPPSTSIRPRVTVTRTRSMRIILPPDIGSPTAVRVIVDENLPYLYAGLSGIPCELELKRVVADDAQLENLRIVFATSSPESPFAFMPVTGSVGSEWVTASVPSDAVTAAAAVYDLRYMNTPIPVATPSPSAPDAYFDFWHLPPPTQPPNNN